MSAISEGDNSNAVDCRSCCAAVPVGRRYCPSCGTRQGEPRVEPGPVLAALAGASMAAQASGGAPPIDAVSAGAAEPRPEGGLLAGVASRSAALTGMALLMLGVVAGAAFSPPVGNSDASAQRVIIVKAPAAVATGPAAQPPVSPVGSDPGVYPGGTVGSTPTGTGSGYAYAPYDQGTSSGSDTGSGSGSGSTTDQADKDSDDRPHRGRNASRGCTWAELRPVFRSPFTDGSERSELTKLLLSVSLACSQGDGHSSLQAGL